MTFNFFKTIFIRLSVIFGLVLVLGLPMIGNAQAGKDQSGIEALNVLQMDCLFPGAPSIKGGDCKGKNLMNEITKFLIRVASTITPVALKVPSAWIIESPPLLPVGNIALTMKSAETITKRPIIAD